jgi:hypothetical protein
MHALFHIRTVVTPSASALGTITVLIWKKTCIDLFIAYFNIESKSTQLTSHTDTNKYFFAGLPHFPSDN